MSVSIASVLPKLGPKVLMERATQQVWLNKTFFGLRCEIATALRQQAPVAKIPVDMQPLTDPHALEAEAQIAENEDALEVYARQKLIEAGIQTAYASRGPAGDTAYIHWLVSESTQKPLHALYPGRYKRELGPGETLLEGAYTFARYRGQGLMAAAEYQLLGRAAAAGSHTTWTYVATDNVPSLRGCARVGFAPDHLRIDRRRMRRMHSEFQALSPVWQRVWDAAVGPKR
jgi:RimJ/RimL family protein N-acetyltransferase